MESFNKRQTQTIMSRVKTAILMNEEGLQLLRQSEYNYAIDTFHEALTVVLDDVAESHVQDVSVAWDIKKTQDIKQQGEPTQMNVVFPTLVASPVTDIHNEIFTMFDQGLDVRTELLDLELNPECFESLVTAVCFYNAGLSHHLLGLQTNSATSLAQAAEHYAISYARFSDCSEGSLGPVLQLPLGVLASVNNLCHLHAYCRNIEQVSTCVEELSFLMSACLGKSPQMVEGCKVFLQNICYFQESVLCAAPAA